MRIMKVLDLSTAHLTEDLGRNLGETTGVIAHEVGEYGFLMWVPDDPMDYFNPNGVSHDVPTEVMNIQLFARSHDCDYVLFDRDADIIPDLPTWDW